MALMGRPPSHPESHASGTSGSHVWSQSTSCCSERLVRFPVARKLAPSTAPVVEKVQHEPQKP